MPQKANQEMVLCFRQKPSPGFVKKLSATKAFLLFLIAQLLPHNHYALRDSIINSIKVKSIERVRIAVSLRTNENDMWKELYEDKTEYLSKEFLKAFEHRTKQ